MKSPYLAVAAVAVLLPLSVACSSSKDIAQDGDTPSQSTPTTPTTPTRSSPSPTAPTTPSVTVTTPTADGSRLEGDGYSVAIPAGWEDITSSLKARNPQLDIAMGQITASGFRTNVNVVLSSSASGPLDPHDSHLRRVLASELKRVTHSPVTQVADTDVAGEVAIGQTSTYQLGGQSVTFIQYFTVHAGHAYPITMTFATSRTAQSKVLFGKILSTWQWTA